MEYKQEILIVAEKQVFYRGQSLNSWKNMVMR